MERFFRPVFSVSMSRLLALLSAGICSVNLDQRMHCEIPPAEQTSLTI